MTMIFESPSASGGSFQRCERARVSLLPTLRGGSRQKTAHISRLSLPFFSFPFVALNQLFFICFVLGWSRFLGFDIFDSTSSTSIGPFKTAASNGQWLFW